MDLHIYHHRVPDPEFLRVLTLFESKLEKIMSTLDTLLADVQAQKTQTDSIVALLHNIKIQLADALSGEKLSPAAEAKLALIMPQLEANTSALTDAINENTDAAPTPAPEPDPVPTTITSPSGGPAEPSTVTPAPSPVDPGVPSI